MDNNKQEKFLYLVSAGPDFGGYDTYSDFVACAESEQEAREMTPDGGFGEKDFSIKYSSWIKFEDINTLEVKLIGKAQNTEKGVVLASFHAG